MIEPVLGLSLYVHCCGHHNAVSCKVGGFLSVRRLSRLAVSLIVEGKATV